MELYLSELGESDLSKKIKNIKNDITEYDDEILDKVIELIEEYLETISQKYEQLEQKQDIHAQTKLKTAQNIYETKEFQDYIKAKQKFKEAQDDYNVKDSKVSELEAKLDNIKYLEKKLSNMSLFQKISKEGKKIKQECSQERKDNLIIEISNLKNETDQANEKTRYLYRIYKIKKNELISLTCSILDCKEEFFSDDFEKCLKDFIKDKEEKTNQNKLIGIKLTNYRDEYFNLQKILDSAKKLKEYDKKIETDCFYDFVKVIEIINEEKNKATIESKTTNQELVEEESNNKTM